MKENKATRRILIVEDEHPLANTLRLKLEDAGYECVVTHDGQEALKTISGEKKFDLILLDLILPKLDGFGVLEELQKTENKTPVIVLTILSQEEDQRKVLSYGVKEYLVKTRTSLADIVKIVQAKLA